MTNRPGKLLLLALAALALAGGGAAYYFLRAPHHAETTDDGEARRPLGSSVTFNKNVAPLVFQHCTACHRPGGAGPFDLLTYDDVQHHAQQIVKVLAARIMPPWKPDGKFGQFVGDRRLRDEDVALVKRWYDQGLIQGKPSDLPPTPTFSDAWTLGPPDLVLELHEPFVLQPDGKDVYRHFVFPTSLPAAKYVRAVELDPGNARVMHHALLLIDKTGASHRRDPQDPSSSFGMMDPGPDVLSPPGQNLSWHAGKRRSLSSEQFPWRLPGGSDVVVQMHLRPTGKAETVAPRLGLYFADQGAAVAPFKIVLRSTSIDIPAGSADFHIQASYPLPVDVDALSVMAHAHYLGKSVEAWAFLPDGKRQPLLIIKDWDFNWQSDYEYTRPLRLPKGTMINFNFNYDNSEGNPRNPNRPPIRVTYGPNVDDEMGELSLQVLPHSQADYATLARDYEQKIAGPTAMDGAEFQLVLHPTSAKAHADLAGVQLEAGRGQDAVKHLETALKIEPNNPAARRAVASIVLAKGDYAQAAAQYESALKGDPTDYRSMTNLGLMQAIQGKVQEGIATLQNALKINPAAAVTHANLARVYQVAGNRDAALKELAIAQSLDPDDPVIQQAIKELAPPKK